MEDFLIIFNKYARSELMVLVPVLCLLTKLIQASKIDNKRLPLIITAISIILCCIYTVGTVPSNTFPALMMALFTSITQGILLSGASIFGGVIFNGAGLSKLLDGQHNQDNQNNQK